MILFNSKTIISAFTVLVYISKVAARPQITATLPFIPDDGPGGDLDDFNDDDHLASGLIVGTGPAGETTYILTMTDDDDDNNNRPITATLVAGASGATVHASYDDDDDDSDDDDRLRHHSVACGIENDSAICTYERVGVIGGQTTTSLTTRTASADRITLIASTGSVPTQTTTGTGDDSNSGTGTGTTFGTGTGTGTGTASGASQTQSSGAQENAAVSLFAGALPMVLAVIAMA